MTALDNIAKLAKFSSDLLRVRPMTDRTRHEHPLSRQAN